MKYFGAVLLLGLAAAPARAQEMDLAASANLLRSLRLNYQTDKGAGTGYDPVGTRKEMMAARALQHEVWTLVESIADRAAANWDDNRDFRFVDFSVAEKLASTMFPEKQLALGSSGNRNEMSKNLSALGTKLNDMRGYSKAFSTMSVADLGDFLSLMAAKDPFRLTTPNTKTTVEINTIDDYQRQIDAVIARVESVVGNSNTQFTSTGYKVATERRWAVYRDVMDQYAKHASDPGADKFLNADNRTVDVDRFVKAGLNTTTNEILRSAKGRTEAQNKRDKVEDIDAQAIAKEVVVPN